MAHLIPAKEEGWFDRNAMSQYSCDVTSNSSVNDVANCLLLRADVHRLFDQHKFVFIPKHASFEVEEEPSLHLVCHLIGSSLELTEYYHNVPLRPTPGLSTEYLLAAFARVIFPLLGPFLRCQRPRRLIIVIGDSITIEEVPGDKCAMMALATGSRSRSVSPRKRAAPGGSSATQDNALALQVSDQSAEEVRGIKGTKVQGTEDIHQMDGFQGYNARTANPSLSTKRVRCSSAAFEGDTNKDQKPDPPSRTDAPSPRPAVKPTESTRPVPKNPAMPAEIYRLASLRTQALHLERKRSGVESWWNLQREWAHNNREGLSPKRIRRLFWYQGRDLESDGEGVPWELEVTSTNSSAYNG